MGTVWDRATEFLGDNIGALFPIILVGIFLPLSISDNLAPLGAQVDQSQKLVLSLFNLVLTIVSMFGQFVVMTMAIDGEQSVRQAIRTVFARLLLILLVTVILLVIVFGLALPIVIALGMANLDMAALSSGNPDQVAAALRGMSPGVAWFIALYAMAWAIAVVWISARLILTTSVVIAERLGVGALGRSFGLTRGITFKIIGVLLLYVIVSFVAILAAKAVFGTVAGLLIGTVGPLTVAGVIVSIAVGLVDTLFTALQSAFLGKLYLAARQRGEFVAGSQ